MASYGKGENEFRIEITDGDLADPQRKSAIKALLDEWQADPSIKLEIPPSIGLGSFEELPEYPQQVISGDPDGK